MTGQDHTPRPGISDAHRETLVLAAHEILEADAIIVGAGAGFSVDSGLPDFRGKHGFWRAYPPAEKLGFCYEDVAGGPWFHENPEMAWGFIVHCARLFDACEPHEGYYILKRWIDEKGDGWVYTSNVDRYFYQAGFDPDKITEIHGFRDRAQCTVPCSRETWPLALYDLDMNEETLSLSSPTPRCPHCGELARPNTLMFNDQRWIGDGTRHQENMLTEWFTRQHGARIVVIELGAGSTVPNVRFQCERYARVLGTPLIRINPGEPEGPEGTLGIAMPALEALRAINAIMLSAQANTTST